MPIIVDSHEYKCWHEVGHATVCLHLGGDVTLIEFLPAGLGRGLARTRADNVTDEMHKPICSAGLAAEVLLLRNGWAQKAIVDIRDHDEIIWHNATGDREDFRGRIQLPEDPFTDQENREFRTYALDVALPILECHLSSMQRLVVELHRDSQVCGQRVRELLGVPKQP